MKKPGLICVISFLAFVLKAQPTDCVLKPPQVTIHFGRGYVADMNSGLLSYERVLSACPTDGHYSFASATGGCFRGDWHTILEDHTAGDVEGNMLLVNAAPYSGVFLSTVIPGLKSNTVYELGLWLMNLCRPTNKCPYPLLPNLYIRLQTPEGKVIANIMSGEVPRVPQPRWTQYRAYFTTPTAITTLLLVMSDNNPGGCGNDFAMDDITFRECVKKTTVTTLSPTKPEAGTNQLSRPRPNKSTRVERPKKVQVTGIDIPRADTISKIISGPVQKKVPPPPLVLKNRENALVKKIETGEGEIKIDLFDNGEIDGDTVSVYHNNTLVRSHMRLSQKPISLTININTSEPHHEIIMVAENLGSIPPNTSVMIINTASDRYQVFISSTEQKNAKVVFDLKK